MAKQRQSFSDAILQEADRFVEYAHSNNKNIKTFHDFKNAFLSAFSTPNGRNAKVDEDDLIVLFESSANKRRMRQNVSDKEYDDLFGDGKVVKRESISQNKQVTISREKVVVKDYKKNGKIVKGVPRVKPLKFSPAQEKYIMVRIQKQYSEKQIFSEFNEHFTESPRTRSSIRNKIGRLKRKA